jgi:carboxypeptidase Taq
MNPSAENAYRELIDFVRETATLQSVESVLNWDERTQMPPKGAEHRAGQIALMARLVHERATSPRIGEWIAVAQSGAEAGSDAAVNLREIGRTYRRNCKLPARLIEELARTEVLSQQAWAGARRDSNFAAFSPWLDRILKLKREQAQCLAESTGSDRLYDALLEDFEPHETTANLRAVFRSLRGPLVELVGQVASRRRFGEKSSGDPGDFVLNRRYDPAAQEKLSREAAAAIGFDFEAGRLDVSTHPFCTGLGPGDTRITTRYNAARFGDAFFGVLHETGHALYVQGLDRAHYGTPIGREISLGIHESQSRLWENLVGRSRSFWRHFFPRARQAFPNAIDDVTPDQWYAAINEISPSLIRVEADETTYNLHVLVRFELEPRLLDGSLAAADLPGAWNQSMRDVLGVVPPDDARGCLQDIHWSIGAFGYFPTYTLGNLYAAQFFERARKDLGDLDGQFAAGNFSPLLGWLREKIHRNGQRFTAAELVKRVTGKELSAEPLLTYLKGKASEIYGV